MGRALHIRDSVPVSAAVATRPRGDGRSMEDRRRKSQINFLLIKCLILTRSDIPIFSMLSTTILHKLSTWQTFCCNLFGVVTYF